MTLAEVGAAVASEPVACSAAAPTADRQNARLESPSDWLVLGDMPSDIEAAKIRFKEVRA